MSAFDGEDWLEVMHRCSLSHDLKCSIEKRQIIPRSHSSAELHQQHIIHPGAAPPRRAAARPVASGLHFEGNHTCTQEERKNESIYRQHTEALLLVEFSFKGNTTAADDTHRACWRQQLAIVQAQLLFVRVSLSLSVSLLPPASFLLPTLPCRSPPPPCHLPRLPSAVSTSLPRRLLPRQLVHARACWQCISVEQSKLPQEPETANDVL